MKTFLRLLQPVMARLVLCLVASLACSLPASATSPAGGPPSSDAEPVGTWRFRSADRPVKVVALGTSTTAWPRGNYTQFIEAACPRVEMKNLAQASIGIRQLKTRLRKQVLKNRHIDRRGIELWVMIRGGLNSLFNPPRVNNTLREIFRLSHRARIGTVALSLTPWGSDGNRRWRDAAGLETRQAMQHTVDYLLGRLSPADALGRYAQTLEWQPGDLPDIAVDLYDSALRHKDAAPRNDKVMRRRLRTTDWVKRELKRLPEPERRVYLDELTAAVSALPSWYMKREYHAFDHIHPNIDGHRIIAAKACPSLPESWGCHCDSIAMMQWDHRKRGLVPRVEAPATAQVSP